MKIIPFTHKTISLFLFLFLSLINLNAEVVVGQSFPSFTLEDQFEKKHTISSDTKKIILVFSKDNGHIMKEYMEGKHENFLSQRNILFIADISRMPSIIASLFAKPDMRECKYPILLIEDEEISKNYKVENKKEFFMIVSVKDTVVLDINFVNNKAELKKHIE